MDFFRYMSQSVPSETQRVLRHYSDENPTNAQELEDCLRRTMTRLRDDDKRNLLEELSEYHPDREIFLAPTDPIESPEGFANACGCGGHASASGQGAVSAYMSGSDANGIMSSYTQDKINKLENEQSTSKQLNQQTFRLVMIAAVIFLAFKIIKK